MRVVVTSKNPEKLAAVESAFRAHFSLGDGADAISVASVPTDSSIEHGQPWGLQMTYEGAKARLHALLKRTDDVAGATYLVSVENGVDSVQTHAATHAFDVACVVVAALPEVGGAAGGGAGGAAGVAVDTSDEGTASPRHREAFAFSTSRPYPLRDVMAMKAAGRSGRDIGAAIRKCYDDWGLSVSRFDQVKDTTVAVLSSLGTGEL